MSNRPPKGQRTCFACKRFFPQDEMRYDGSYHCYFCRRDDCKPKTPCRLCEKAAFSIGLCPTHHMHWRRDNKPEIDGWIASIKDAGGRMKPCPDCGRLILPLRRRCDDCQAAHRKERKAAFWKTPRGRFLQREQQKKIEARRRAKKRCVNCGKSLESYPKRSVFCSQKCYAAHQNRRRLTIAEQLTFIQTKLEKRSDDGTGSR